MPMKYAYTAIPDSHVPRAQSPIFQHLLDSYASETNKVISVWRCFSAEDMSFQPHARSKTVLEIMKHQLLSERRFFGEFMGLPEPPASPVLPAHETPEDYVRRMQELAEPRLTFFASQSEAWWLRVVCEQQNIVVRLAHGQHAYSCENIVLTHCNKQNA